MVYKKIECAPQKKNNNISCLDKKLILKIAKILNKNDYNIDLKNNINKIYNDISKILKKYGKCDLEKCWREINLIITNLSIKDIKNLNNSFKPDKPLSWKKEHNTWLTNLDIDNVLKQYNNKYDDYYYHGAIPVDFDIEVNGSCLLDNLCDFDINELNNSGKKKVSMVFNTDPHNKSGEHWISLYIDSYGNNLIEQKDKYPCIYFFDSTGNPPPKEIKDFIKDTQDKSDIVLTYIENDVQHQTGNTECGIYCLHFLDYMINEGNFIKYINNKNNDKFMEKYRSIFFI